MRNYLILAGAALLMAAVLCYPPMRVASAGPAQQLGQLARGGVDADGNQTVNTSAKAGAVNSEQCVTNAAGGTAITLPASARSFALQNQGPNHVSCTLDGTLPTATVGWRIAGLAAGESSVADSLPVDCTAKACPVVTCIAGTAAQSTGACLNLVVLK